MSSHLVSRVEERFDQDVAPPPAASPPSQFTPGPEGRGVIPSAIPPAAAFTPQAPRGAQGGALVQPQAQGGPGTPRSAELAPPPPGLPFQDATPLPGTPFQPNPASGPVQLQNQPGPAAPGGPAQPIQGAAVVPPAQLQPAPAPGPRVRPINPIVGQTPRRQKRRNRKKSPGPVGSRGRGLLKRTKTGNVPKAGGTPSQGAGSSFKQVKGNIGNALSTLKGKQKGSARLAAINKRRESEGKKAFKSLKQRRALKAEKDSPTKPVKKRSKDFAEKRKSLTPQQRRAKRAARRKKRAA